MPLNAKDLEQIGKLIKDQLAAQPAPVPAAITPDQLAVLIQQILAALLPTIESLISKALEKSSINPPAQTNVNNWGAPPKTFPSFEMLHMAIYADKVENPGIYSKKKLSAVIERLSETNATDEEDNESIEEKVQAVVDSEEFPEDLDKSFTVKRHGKKRDKWHRPIKVHFNQPDAAAAFIRAFRLVHKPTKNQPSPFARRDLSMPELALQNAQKKWVAEWNKNAKKEERFTYRNLNIFRSFPQKPQKSF